MKRNSFESLSIDELCVFRKQVATALAAKLIAEKNELEIRLIQLTGETQADQIGNRSKRRSYPTVFPKYRNPNQPSQTWAGRANSLAGWQQNSSQVNGLTIFELNLVLRKYLCLVRTETGLSLFGPRTSARRTASRRRSTSS